MSARRHSQESGFALLLVFAMAAILAITLYLELPRVAFEAQRNKEQLLLDRGGEYKRGIQLFVRKFGRFPAKIEDLENTNNVRFLRRRYKDPMTGADEWRLIHAAPGGVYPDSITMKPDPNESPTPSSGSGSSFGSSMGSGSFGQSINQATPTPTPDTSYANGGYPGQPGQNQPPSGPGMRRRQSEMMGLYQNQNQNQDPNNPYAQQGYNPGDPNAPQPQAGQAMQPGQYPGGGQPGNNAGAPTDGSQSGGMGYTMGTPIDPTIGQAPPTPTPTPFIPCGRMPPNTPGCEAYYSNQQGTGSPQGTGTGSIYGGNSGNLGMGRGGANPGVNPNYSLAGSGPPASYYANQMPMNPSPDSGSGGNGNQIYQGNTGGGGGGAPMPQGIQQGLYSGSQQSSSPVTMGGGIAGVASNYDAPSIRIWRVKKKEFKKYSEWEFIYDPANDTSSLSGLPNQVNIGGTIPGSPGFGSNTQSNTQQQSQPQQSPQ